MKATSRIISFLLLILFLSSCAASGNRERPNFYPNDRLREAGPAQADRDVAHCESLANEYVQQGSKWGDVAIDTGTGAVVGAGAGAVGGAIMGNTGRGTAVGAATGALYGLYQATRDSMKTDPNWKRFVEECLADKGYQVYGWN
jgi:hypothetical protein